MEFSEKLITLRKSKELTQEQLAEQLNVSRQSISAFFIEKRYSHCQPGNVVGFFLSVGAVPIAWIIGSVHYLFHYVCFSEHSKKRRQYLCAAVSPLLCIDGSHGVSGGRRTISAYLDRKSVV